MGNNYVNLFLSKRTISQNEMQKDIDSPTSFHKICQNDKSRVPDVVIDIDVGAAWCNLCLRPISPNHDCCVHR